MKTVSLNPAELRMHWTRKELPVPAKDRVNAIADAIKAKVKLPPIYVVEPNLVVAGWTRTLAHKQMQQDIECVLITEDEAELVALGENTNRQGYRFSYQIAWVYMPLVLKVVEHAKKRQLDNLRKGAEARESTSERSGKFSGTIDDIAERIGVSRTLLFNVKEAYENIIGWDAKHEPCCWGDDKTKRTAFDYCHAKVMDAENPCTPGNAWAGVAGKQAAHEGKTKPAPKQLELFCEGTRSVAKWAKNFDKFSDDEYRKAVKSVKDMVAAMPPTLREEVLTEIKRLAREQKEAQA